MKLHLHASKKTFVSLLFFLVAIGTGCMSQDFDEEIILRDPIAAQAGKASFAWMKARVDLMVQNKANCGQMAELLLENDRQTDAQRKAWRTEGAQAWLVAKSASDFEFQKELSEVITRGDLVFSFCSFFEDFRTRLKN